MNHEIASISACMDEDGETIVVATYGGAIFRLRILWADLDNPVPTTAWFRLPPLPRPETHS